MNNSDVNAKLRAETVAMLRAVLISSPLGVRFEKLYRDYRQLTGKTIPYQALGFPKLEFFIQSIPDVARAEKGANGEWTLKGVASDADKHVAKLISKQKKPKVRKSAKLMMFKRANRAVLQPLRFNTPVKETRRSPVQSQRSYIHVAPRFQRLQEQGGNSSYSRTSGVTDLRPKLRVPTNEFIATNRKVSICGKKSDGSFGGSFFHKVTEDVRVSRTGCPKNNRSVTSFHSNTSKNSQEKGSPQEPSPISNKMSINVSNNNTGRSIRTVTATSPPSCNTSTILQDPSVLDWIKAEISNTPNGLWATRLSVLFKEKFKRELTDSAIIELKSRPDIVRMDEPIEGTFLLYAPIERHPQPEQRQLATQIEREAPVQCHSSQDKEASTTVPPAHRIENLDVMLPSDLPDVGSTCLVYITHVENVGCFYVSKIDSVSTTLSNDILKEYENTKHDADAILSIKPDQVFCAQFAADNSFYRASVLEIVNRKQVSVLYVDFGNQEVIDVEHLRILKKEFQSQPVQAFRCCLDGIQPVNEDQDWSEAALKRFSELVDGKELKMSVKDSEGKILSVCLYDDSSKLDVGEELLKAAVATPIKNLPSTPSSSSSSLSSSSGAASEKPTLAKKDGISRSRRVKPKSPGTVELPESAFIDVLVCNITGTYNVYLRLVGEEYSKKFEAIQESMTSYYSDSKDEVTTEPVAGDLFALLSDDVWCRVKVMSVNGPTIKVFFVDHGDMAETNKSELRTLAPQFQQLPFQVLQCALNGLPKTKNPDVVDKLQKLSMSEVCVAEVIKRGPDLVFVELIDTRNDANIVVNDVIRKLVIPDEELKPVLPKVGETVEVYIPYISPSGSVFLHILGAGTKRLEELNRDLTDHYVSTQAKANEFVSSPTVGKVYCAKCDKDSNWYRVKVISASDRSAVEVLYVDYGNCDTVISTNLREPTPATDHVLSLPFQALECQLYDIPKDYWNEDFAKEVMDTLTQGVVMAEVLSEGDLPSVSLVVTINGKEDEQPITERLTGFLGIQYDEDDVKDAIETLHDGDKETLVNGDAHDVDESETAVVDGNPDPITVDQNEGICENKDEARDVDESETSVAGESPGITVDHNEGICEDKDEIHFSRKDKRSVPDGGEQNVADEERGTDVNENQQAVTYDVVKPCTSDDKIAVDQDDLTVDIAQDVQRFGNEGIGNEVAGSDEVQGAVTSEIVNKPISGKELPLVSGWMDILVTNVKDPSNFTFQLLANVNELCDLTDKMNEYYQENSPIDETPVEGGVYAVFKDDDDSWYRANVKEIMKDEKVYVDFVDYGDAGVIESEKENIQPLHEDFLQLPFQGVQGSLAGVACLKRKWSKECINYFKYRTLDCRLVAKVTSGETTYHLNQNSHIVVELYDTSDPNEDVSVAEKLIECKYAKAEPPTTG